MKIAFFGYDFFANCLNATLEANHEVIRIFSVPTDNVYNFNEQVLEAAAKSKVPVSLSKVREADIANLEAQGCELIVSAAYPYRIPIGKTTVRGINIHPSLLPNGRGPWPLPHVILKRLKETGVTIHKLEPDFDAGEIIVQRSFPVSEVDNLESLSCRSQMLARDLLLQVLGDFENLWTKSEAQGRGEKWEFPSDEEQTIRWTDSVEDIDRLVRAYGKMHTTAIFDSLFWNIEDVAVWSEAHAIAPGTVVHRANKEVVIAAQDGFVCLRYFQKDVVQRETSSIGEICA